MSIDEATKELIGLIQQSRTKDVLHYAATELLKLFDTGVIGSPLRSPYKQMFHLLGLMLCTPENSPSELGGERWARMVWLLNEITENYARKYFRKDGEEITDEWKRTRQVAMPAFLHYFNTLPLVYREQLIERIEAWYVPFDKVFGSGTGIAVSKCLQMTIWIEHHVQASWERVWDLSEAAADEQDRFLKEVEGESLTLEETRRKAQSHPVSQTFNDLLDAMNRMLVIDVEVFRQTFGSESVDRFLDLFAAKRGEYKNYHYPTEENPAELHPLFFAEHDSLMCPAPRILLLALSRHADRILKSGSKGGTYYKHRDRELEKKAASVLNDFLPQGTAIHPNVCESEAGVYEHDIVVLLGEAVLVVECKATQQREPFRDPEKAYLRLRHEFRSDAGIQKAYEQAEHLRRRLISQKQVVLYDKQGRVAVEIEGPVSEVFCICVTLDTFGIVATNLSLLLEKSADNPYPWAVSIFDLETILGGFAYEKKGVVEFLTFLRQRAKLHGRVIATDELEIVGAFLMAGNFNRFLSTTENEVFFATPDMSGIFDDIYFEKHGFQQRPRKRKKPTFLDAREEFKKVFGLKSAQASPPERPHQARVRIGRNDPCPCGSGLKFKKCHGLSRI